MPYDVSNFYIAIHLMSYVSSSCVPSDILL
jgi:hypothetical protein